MLKVWKSIEQQMAGCNGKILWNSGRCFLAKGKARKVLRRMLPMNWLGRYIVISFHATSPSSYSANSLMMWLKLKARGLFRAGKNIERVIYRLAFQSRYLRAFFFFFPGLLIIGYNKLVGLWTLQSHCS